MEPEKLLNAVERMLAKHGMPPSTFGRLAVKDPMLVYQLREGRELRSKTRERLLAFMREWRG